MIDKRAGRRLWLLIDLNAVLWLLLGPAVMPDGSPRLTAGVVLWIVGLVLAAVLHHLAYHRIYKELRKDS